MQNNDRGKLMKKIKYERITSEMKDERKRKTRKKNLQIDLTRAQRKPRQPQRDSK